MKDLLDRMKKALENLAADEPAGETMTPDQFVAYAAEQVEKAAADKDPKIRKARLAHLAEQVATVQKNFEGQVPAALPVARFKDADQATPTTTDMGNPAPQNQGESGGNFASNPVPTPQAAVGSQPPGGANPGPTNASSGAPGYPEQFAKAMETLTKAIEKLNGAPAAPAAAAPAATPAAPAAPAAAPDQVQKGMGVIWPADMNSSFGRGLADGEDEPTWGYDKGSAAAGRAETRKNAQG